MNQKHVLNARRLLCPMPVIRTQEKVKTLKTGDILEVTCTDSGVLQDIPAWCRINGHKILESFNDEYDYVIVLEVGELRAPGSNIARI
jgi:tRNA 2-thiouridine synthesizing protein A